MRTYKAFTLLLIGYVIILAWGSFTEVRAMAAQDERDPMTIVWPSSEFRTLQAAIDATPEGGTVRILEGVYHIEPVYVRRRITIVGAGSGRGGEDPVTHLVGPPTNPVVDRDGNLILTSDAVVGIINIFGAEAVVRDLKLSRGDAGVVARNNERGNSGRIFVERCVISNTGRGFLSRSSGDVTIRDTTIRNTLWHGIAMHPPLNPVKFNGSNLALLKGLRAGMYFKNTFVVAFDDTIDGWGTGGIVAINSKGFINACKIKNNLGPGIYWDGLAANGNAVIMDNFISNNIKAGIFALNWPNPCPITPTDADPYPCLTIPVIQNNRVQNTLVDQNGELGDGLALSDVGAVFVNNNIIENNGRAGVGSFGSLVSLVDNLILACQSLLPLVVGHSVNNTPGSFINGGGNDCGCQYCVSQGPGLQAPEPLVDLGA